MISIGSLRQDVLEAVIRICEYLLEAERADYLSAPPDGRHIYCDIALVLRELQHHGGNVSSPDVDSQEVNGLDEDQQADDDTTKHNA